MKVLADTSVWIDHLRSPQVWFSSMLRREDVYGHPFVLGELLLGSLRGRQAIRSQLESLPQLRIPPQADLLAFVEQHALFSRGIGYVDVNLLFSSYLAGCHLLTRDKSLGALAEEFGLRFAEP